MKKSLLMAVFIFLGCAPIYTAPNLPTGAPQNELVLERSFDDVWTALVEHVGSTFFAIDSFGKDSGLMTLTFGSSNVSQFIDCGWLKTQNLANFDGPAIMALEREARSTSFTGRMNIVVKRESPTSTRIRVNARYVYQAIGQKFAPTWTFDSNGSATQRVGVTYVTCRPTNAAEREVLMGVSAKLKGPGR